MTQYGTWISYSGGARIELAIVLLAIAGGLAYAGTRLALPVQPARPGRKVITFLLVTWALATAAFPVCLALYVHQAVHQYPTAHFAPADHILPVTLIAAGLTFLVIFKTSPDRSGTRLASAVIGAAAAPMLFELPFDLIVMARTYPALPPHPEVYRALFFVPLFLIEITTLSLLTLSPMVKVSRGAFLAVASMLAVFAAWSLSGFAYPSAPIPTALNVVSKLLAFVTVLCLFLPQRAKAPTPDPAPAPADLARVNGGSHGSR